MAYGVKMARYKNPLAVLKPLGMLGSLVACVTACVTMLRTNLRKTLMDKRRHGPHERPTHEPRRTCDVAHDNTSSGIERLLA